MAFSKLDDLCRQLAALDHAQAILGADEATHMAPGGGSDRADAMAQLAGMAHRMMTVPQVGDWLAAAQNEALDAEQQAAIREFARVHGGMTALPAAFVEQLTATRMSCEQAWRKLRPAGDWNSFVPLLGEVLTMVRDEAGMRAEQSGLSAYDALIDLWDPGTRSAQIEPVFARLKTFLKDFVPNALAVQQERTGSTKLRRQTGPYDTDRQRRLGFAAMEVAGFDFERGSLAESVHPFCGGVPSDVRITTRYRNDEFLSSLMGVLHETGHALYEQNLPARWAHWPSGKARGMAMHESQSLFVEKQIGRNPAFWQFFAPRIGEFLGEAWTADEIMPQIHKVEPGLIRVDADEATYPLHIILRFELEQALVGGSMEVADLPEAWDARMREYFGLATIDDPANGPMQDVHWPSGAFGYFPSYTLGALMAAQQWAAIAKSGIDAQADLARGDVSALNEWRRRHIWSKGSMVTADEIMRQATGLTLDPAHFMAHLEARYLDG